MNRSLTRFAGCTLLAALLAGCGQPQVASGNRRLIESLRTAISAKKTDWLEDNARLIDERHAGGTLSDEEFAVFSAIISESRAGEWQAAEQHVIALGKGQKAAP
jgi:hypothetical protein